jgi:hypothetical protein
MNDSYEEERLTQALEAVPKFEVPEDFALRVMAALPPGKIAPELVPAGATVGRRVSVAAMVVLAALMLGLAHWSWGAAGDAHEGLKAVEWMLCAEFVGLTLWLGRGWSGGLGWSRGL